MNTMELIITDLLNCGYMDISMLDILYSPLAEEIGLDSRVILQDAITMGNGMNGAITTAYNEITYAITERLTSLMEEYENSLDTDEEGNPIPTKATPNTDLYRFLEDSELDFTNLNKEQINLIHTNITEMENSYPFANYMDSHFQNTLDQTLNEDYGVDRNCQLVLEYWLS
jgi:hypothetical protein